MNSLDITELSLILKNLLSNSRYPDDVTKHRMMNVIYSIENKLHQMEQNHQLHHLDNSIISDSVVDSFSREIPLKSQNEKSKEDGTFEFRNYLRGLDYQYWLLIYLLLKNNEILKGKIILHKIIDMFIGRIKDESFQYEDIKITSSGATRCKTNLRFAINSLRKAGLVNYVDERYKQSWTLTYLGYFTAASFLNDPDPNRPRVFSKKILRIRESGWYFTLDPVIKNRIYQLASPDNFLRLIHYLEMDSLDLPMLKKGYVIFGDYRSFFEKYQHHTYGRKRSENEIKKLLERFLINQNREYNLNEFMLELSMKYNAEEFFRELMDSASM